MTKSIQYSGLSSSENCPWVCECVCDGFKYFRQLMHMQILLDGHNFVHYIIGRKTSSLFPIVSAGEALSAAR